MAEPKKTKSQNEELPTIMDADAFKQCPKYFAQSVNLQITHDEAVFNFGIRTQGEIVGADDKLFKANILVPQAIVFVTLPHFRRLLKLMQEQLAVAEARIREETQPTLPDQVQNVVSNDN